MEIKLTKVSRDESLNTQKLVEHVKAVGQAIIDDADKIAFDADDLLSIEIEADVAPFNQATVVEYRLRRIADPRKDVYGRTEETKAKD